MKLRIKGNSLRLRVARSEMATLLETGAIEDTIFFGDAPGARLTYALEHGRFGRTIGVEYRAQRVAVLLETEAARRWSQDGEVGIYGSADTGHGPLELVVEKDFACLDGDDPQDADAFPNPSAAGAC